MCTKFPKKYRLFVLRTSQAGAFAYYSYSLFVPSANFGRRHQLCFSGGDQIQSSHPSRHPGHQWWPKGNAKAMHKLRGVGVYSKYKPSRSGHSCTILRCLGLIFTWISMQCFFAPLLSEFSECLIGAAAEQPKPRLAAGIGSCRDTPPPPLSLRNRNRRILPELPWLAMFGLVPSPRNRTQRALNYGDAPYQLRHGETASRRTSNFCYNLLAHRTGENLTASRVGSLSWRLLNASLTLL